MRALSALRFAAGSGDRLRTDTIHRNARVVTVDDDFRIVEAFAVVGSEAEVPSAFPDGAEREADFGGKTVLPGVNDNHIHLGPGRTLQNWQDGLIPGLPERSAAVTEPGALLLALEAEAAATPGGAWIRGGLTRMDLTQRPHSGPLAAGRGSARKSGGPDPGTTHLPAEFDGAGSGRDRPEHSRP